MAKIKIANSLTDSVLMASGRAKVVTRTSSSDSKIENSNKDDLRISVMSSKMMEDEDGTYEVAKIKVASVDGRRSSIAAALSSGRTSSNHVSSVVKLVNLNDSDLGNITPATPTYSIDSRFNYTSKDYDELQKNIAEHNLNAFFDDCTKDEVLNFKKLKNAKLTTFSRGDRMKNFVISQKLPNKFSNSCPYSINLKINDRVQSGVSQFLQKISIYDEVMNDYLQSPKTPLRLNVQNGSTVMENVEMMGYDLASFFNSEIEIDIDNFYGLNQATVASTMSYNLRKHLFKGYLKAITKTGFRSYSDLLRNVEASKESLCYSIEKFDEFELDSTRVQNIYAPAGDVETTFADTQVKYGKAYVYKVKAHYMIVGNSYSYRNVRYYNDDGVFYATAEVVNKPNIMIVPIDLFVESKSIIQPPPVYPQVQFKTENNSTKEIQIYLSPTKNAIESNFVEITSLDASQKELMEQFYSQKNGKFKYSTAVDSGLYEVFRLSYAPKSEADFANSKIGEARMPYRTTDAIFKDVVDSNRDYYYMFRQVNEKGMASNPTSVFKTMLVVDADDAKVVVDTYRYPTPAVSEPRRNFKSLLQIKPAVEQVLFAEEQDALYNKTSLKGTIDDLKLGTQADAIWGRKFKLRIRSTTSGKMMDININFELAKNKSKEEF